MSGYRMLITVGGAVAGGGIAALMSGPDYPGVGPLVAGLLLVLFTVAQIQQKRPADKPAEE